jgi:hypothetical protein
MAIAFELVADFDGDKDSADSCRQWIDLRIAPVEIDEYTINIHRPLTSGYPYENPTRFQVSVIPANVGCLVALDDTHDRIPLTGTQLSLLGKSLYDLLRGAPGYQLAMVGWDVDFLLHVDALNADWACEIRDGSFGGLVASKSLLPKLPGSPHFVEFDEEHAWIPYTGSQAL